MTHNLKDYLKHKHSQVTCIFIEMLIRRFPRIASAAPMKMFCGSKIITMQNYILIIIYFKNNILWLNSYTIWSTMSKKFKWELIQNYLPNEKKIKKLANNLMENPSLMSLK